MAGRVGDHEARIAYLERVLLDYERRIVALERVIARLAAMVRAVRRSGS